MNINNVCSIPPDVSSVTFKMPSNELLFATTATVKNIPYDFLRTVSIFPLYRIDKMRIIHQNMIFDIMEYNIVFPFMFPFIIIKIAATIPSDIALNDIAKKIIISFITKIS